MDADVEDIVDIGGGRMSDKKRGHQDQYIKYKKDTPTLFFKVMK